jgi:hypothetical protein
MESEDEMEMEEDNSDDYSDGYSDDYSDDTSDSDDYYEDTSDDDENEQSRLSLPLNRTNWLRRNDALRPTHRRDIADLQSIIDDIKDLMTSIMTFIGAGLWPMLNSYRRQAMDVMAAQTKKMVDEMFYFLSHLYMMAYFYKLDMLDLVYYD